MLDVSPWPWLMSMAVLSSAIGIVSPINDIPQFVAIGLIALQWWRDVIREAKGGYHTTIVQRGLLIGFLLF